MIISEKSRIRNVSRQVGIMAPIGVKYVLVSQVEVQLLHSMVTSYGSTGCGAKDESEKLERYDYISFFMGSDQYYVDLLTIKEDIRSQKIGCLIEE
jgi:hypothetical protein